MTPNHKVSSNLHGTGRKPKCGTPPILYAKYDMQAQKLEAMCLLSLANIYMEQGAKGFLWELTPKLSELLFFASGACGVRVFQNTPSPPSSIGGFGAPICPSLSDIE